MKKILITGSSGLVGSEAVLYFDRLDYQVYGLDNNMRKEFFGIEGDTSSTKKFLIDKTNYIDLYFDIRNREKVLNLFICLLIKFMVMLLMKFLLMNIKDDMIILI